MELDGQHEPLWYEHAELTTYPHLMENASCDVAIVGGGITGLTAALSLCQSGCDIVLIDLNRIGRGTTGHSTGHLDNHYDMKLKNLISHLDIAAARTFIDAKREAIARIEQWDKHYGLNCGFRRVPGYYYTETSQDISMIEEEIDAAGRLALDPIALNNASLPFRTQKAMCLPDQGRFSPMAYVTALSRFIFLLGGRIYEHTRMEDFHEHDGKVLIETTHGRIEANKLILAGHTALTGKVSLQTRIFPRLSYVIAAEVEDAIEDALYWDTNDPYYYTRMWSQQHPEILIIGGADRPCGAEDADNPFHKLEDYARQRYRLRSIRHYWSHEYFVSADGLPFVGRVPWSENVYVAAAYSGDGLTLGTAAGTLLKNMITGQEDPLADILSPERVNPGVSVPRVARFMTHIAKHYVMDRIADYADNIEAIAEGQGGLIKIEDQVHAVYKDADHSLFIMSPVCRHMGCIVHWNSIDNTWDCPCHGGRYDCYGNVFMGPPRKPLKRESLKVLEVKAGHR